MASTDSLKEQAEILAAFNCFAHDNEGLALVCHSTELMSLCLRLMAQLLAERAEDETQHCASSTETENEEHDQLEAAVRGEFDNDLWKAPRPVSAVVERLVIVV